MIAAPSTTPSGSDDDENTRLNASRRHATSMASRNAANMATPPSVGRGHVMDTPLIGGDDGPPLHGEVTHERGEHERGDGGDATDDEVGAQARHRMASLGRERCGTEAAQTG